METKDTNPKDAIAGSKAPLGLFPSTAIAAGSLAFLEGALKYGQANWRVSGIRASVYRHALDRHLLAWWEGEDTDPDSGLPHLWKALACVAILIDADAAGTVTDDRPAPGGYAAMAEDLPAHVARLRELHGPGRSQVFACPTLAQAGPRNRAAAVS